MNKTEDTSNLTAQNQLDPSVSTWLNQQQAEMESVLREWSEINSGSFNAEGVNTYGQTVHDYINAHLDVRSERIELPPVEVVNAQGEI